MFCTQCGANNPDTAVVCAQCGHEVRGTFVKSIVGTISKRRVGGKWPNPSSKLTPRQGDSMFRANFSARVKQHFTRSREGAWHCYAQRAGTA